MATGSHLVTVSSLLCISVVGIALLVIDLILAGGGHCLNSVMAAQLNTTMKRRIFLTALFALPATARAHSSKLGEISIGHAWALPSQQTDGQVFFPLVNNGKMADALVAARSEVCTLIELRKNNRYDDPPLASMPLESGRPLPMRPTARHLRLIGLSKPLIDGDRFHVILDFLNAGETEIEVIIEKTPGA